MRTVLGTLFMFQLLVVCALLGLALKDQKEYRIPFGKLFFPYKLQIGMALWLIVSLMANLLFVFWYVR